MTRALPSCADHDVVGLEVAVDQAGGVGGDEAFTG
jgi:hypothetical protein